MRWINEAERYARLWIFGKDNINSALIWRTYILLTLGSLNFLAWGMVDGFIFIFYLQQLSINYVALGFSLQMFIVLVLDFPSSIWADSGHQLTAYALAMAFYGLALFIFIVKISPITFLLSMALIGMGRSQESGSLIAWYTNYYRTVMPTFTLYRRIRGRIGALILTVYMISIAIGGTIADFIWIYWPFYLGISIFGLCTIITIVIARLEKSKNDVRKNQRSFNGELPKQSYIRKLYEVFSILGKNTTLIILFSAIIVFSTVSVVWEHFIILPLYQHLIGSFSLLSIIMAITTAFGIISRLYSHKIRPNELANKTLALIWFVGQGPVAFAATLAFLILLPQLTYNQAIMTILLVILYVAPKLSAQVAIPFHQQVLHENLPNTARASLTSLLSTLTKIFTTIAFFLISIINVMEALNFIVTLGFILSLIACILMWNADKQSEPQYNMQKKEKVSVVYLSNPN